MKKGIIYTLLMLILLTTVLGQTITTSSSVLGTESASITATINETTTAIGYIATDSGFTSIVATNIFSTNATSFTYTDEELTGNTLYYFKFSGLTETPEKYWNSTIGNFTTTDYTLNNTSTRIILNLFVFILIAWFTVAYILVAVTSGEDIKTMVVKIASVLLGAIILFNFVTSVLAV